MSHPKPIVLLILAILLSSSSAIAQSIEVPHFVNFQSVLRDDSGNLITDSAIDLEFKILDQDGNQLYYELQPGVQVVRGAVNVMIGEGVVPGSSPAAPTGGVPSDSLDPATGSKFIQVKVGTNLPSEPMEFGSVPYAFYAEKALGLAGSIPADQLPTSITTDEELNAHTTSPTAHPATSITVIDEFDNSNSGNVQDVLDDLDAALTQEKTDRASGDANLQTQITNEINARTSADANLQSQINTLNSTVADHEGRITALESAGNPVTLTRSLTWRTDMNNASGGLTGSQDATAWSLSGVATADGRWVTLVRNPIIIPTNCIAIASGTISPNVSAGTQDNYDWDDTSHLRITSSGTQINLTAYALGNDGRYEINFQVIAIPTTVDANCALTP